MTNYRITPIHTFFDEVQKSCLTRGVRITGSELDVEIEDEVPSNLDEEVDFALANIEKGKSSGDMSLVMNEGIMKLLAVTQKDSNNIRAIYYLGLFSLESGQLQKAEKRFEKLVSLQPQNEEYVNTLQKIRNQIGK